MTYVFMRALESAPRRYEAGMRVLMLGRLEQVRQDIADRVRAGDRVLDIGCGTGALAVALARRGAHVTGIDVSLPMLTQAAERVHEEGWEDRVELKELGAVDLDTAFEDNSLDVVVSVLVFSELSDEEREYTLSECWRIVRVGGLLLVADEVLPKSALGKVGTALFRLPFAIAAFVLTQNTSGRVAGLGDQIASTGFHIVDTKHYLMGTMALLVAEKGGEHA